MLTINLEWDANAAAAPQSFRDGVQAAANIIEAAITNPITVNIEVGYGEIDLGGPEYSALTGGYSLGGALSSVQLSYPALRAALATNETSAVDTQSVNALPNTATLNGQSTFAVSSAVAKAFGALPATSSAIDGIVGFPTSFTGSGLLSTAITEEVHALGLLDLGGDLGLFSYTSPGNHFLPTGITSSTPAYFSLDGGNTNLANYNVSGDETLFQNVPNDPLDFPSGGSGLTALDLKEIDAIGFDVTSTPALATPEFPTTTTAAGTSAVLKVQNASVAPNGSIASSSLLQSVSVPSGSSISSHGFYDYGHDNGYLSFDGIAEPDKQWIYVLDTQLNDLTYVGASTPGSETIEVGAFASPSGTAQLDFATVTTTTPTATVTGAGNAVLTLYLPTPTLATQVQPQLSAVSTSIAAGRTIANSAGSNGTLSTLPSGTPGLAEIDNGGFVSLLAGYTTVIDQASGPSTVISAAAGNQLVVDDSASSFLYSAVAGAETVYAGGPGVLFGNSASMDVFAGSGALQIVGGTGGNTVSGGSGTLLMFGSGQANYSGGSGSATVIGGSGGTTANMGAGGGEVFGSPGGNNILSTGTGNATLVGAGTGDVVVANNAGSDLLVAGAGSETLNGANATGSLVMFSGAGSDVLLGGSGNDLLIAEANNATFTGGGGTNSYVFVATPGSTRVDTITDFDPTRNSIGLYGYGDASSTGLAAYAAGKTVNGATSFSLSDGTTIVLNGSPVLHNYNFFNFQ